MQSHGRKHIELFKINLSKKVHQPIIKLKQLKKGGMIIKNAKQGCLLTVPMSNRFKKLTPRLAHLRVSYLIKIYIFPRQSRDFCSFPGSGFDAS